jgi:hypothetical protein
MISKTHSFENFLKEKIELKKKYIEFGDMKTGVL